MCLILDVFLPSQILGVRRAGLPEVAPKLSCLHAARHVEKFRAALFRITRVLYWVALRDKGKGKVGRAPPERRRGAHLPFKAIEPVGG